MDEDQLRSDQSRYLLPEIISGTPFRRYHFPGPEHFESSKMPVLEINTNTTVNNKKELALKASKLMAKLLGKPEYVPVPHMPS